MSLSWLVLITLVTGLVSVAKADDPAAVRAFIAAHAKPLGEDKVFYRWQSTESGENLARIGTVTQAVNAHFVKQSENISAGPGLYLAGSPYSSADYLPKTGGNLIEVHVPKGTRILDLQDLSVVRALRQARLMPDAFYQVSTETDGVILKYSRDWFVGKNLSNAVRFEMFPGPQHTAATLGRIIDAGLSGDHPRAAGQAIDQIRGRRPEVLATYLKSDRPLNAPLMSLLPDQDLIARLTRALRPVPAKNDPAVATAELNQTVTLMAREPRVAALIAAQPELQSLALGRLTAVDLERLAPRDIDFLQKLALDAPAASGEALAKKILMQSFDDPQLINDWSKLAHRVLPLLARVHLTADESASFGRKMTSLLDRLMDNVSHVGELRPILRAARLRDATLEQRIRDAEGLSAKIDRAVASGGSVADLRATLVNHAGFDHLTGVIEHLGARVPNDRVAEAVDQTLREDPGYLKRVMRKPDDYGQAALMIRSVPSAFDEVYRAAVDADVGARAKFLQFCMRAPACVEKLLTAASHDQGRIFAHAGEMRFLNDGLRTLTFERQSATAERLAKFIIPRLETSAHLLEFMDTLGFTSVARNSKTEILARAGAIGLNTFRAPDLLRLGEIIGDDDLKRDLTKHALRVAMNTKDVAAVETFARHHRLEIPELEPALKQRRLDLESNPTADHGCLNHLGQVIGR